MAGIGVLGSMTPNNVEKSQGFMRNAISAHSARTDKYREKEEEKTIGGGIMSAIGGAGAGFQVGGPWGALAGGVIGAAGYALS
jgi:hypothetical protein